MNESRADLLEIRLFGEPEVRYCGSPALLKVPRLALALLGYLTATSGQIHQRSVLANMIWPDDPEVQARANLRRHLHLLTHALPGSSSSHWLAITSRSVSWEASVNASIDVIEFRRLLRAGEERQAVQWVKGDFLETVDEPWIQEIRRTLREDYLQALLRIVKSTESEHDVQTALRAAQAFIREEPWREDIVRQTMSLLAASGNIASAMQEYNALAERLRVDLGVAPSADTIEMARTLQAQTAGPALAQTPRLPEFATHFVGRDREQTEIAALLAEHRLVTITGFGGMGKTRIAAKIAGAASQDAAFFADLTSCNSESVIEAIATALDRTKFQGKFSLDAIAEHIETSPALLVLDNCEHVIEKCRVTIAYLLQRCPRLRILATSREALHYPGEALFLMPPLDGADSAILFTKRASCVKRDFQMTDQNVQTILAVCARVDGIPLAIEIAAARLSAFSIETLSERLALRPRLDPLRDTINWSFNLLNEEERATFCNLAIFEGGCEISAATAVAGSLEIIEALIGKSLVSINKDAYSERLRLLEVVRLYALERLSQGNAEEPARDRHMRYFTHMVDGLWDESRPANAQVWISAFERDRGNIKSAFRWAFRRGDASAAMTLGICLGRFAESRGRLGEDHILLREAAELALKAPPSAQSADVLHYAAIAAARAGNFEDSGILNAQALAMRQNVGDPLGAARSLHNEACNLLARGDYERAQTSFEDALETFRELAEPRYVSIALDNLGELQTKMGRFEEAEPFYDESLRIARSLGYDRGIAWRLAHIGLNFYFRGDRDLANSHFMEALQYATAAQDEPAIAEILRGLGCVAADRGNFKESFEYLRRCYSMHENMSDDANLARDLEAFANLFALQGRYEQAARCMARARNKREATLFRLHPAERKWLDRVDSILAGEAGYEAILRREIRNASLETPFSPIG